MMASKEEILKAVKELPSVKAILWMADNSPCFAELLGDDIKECGCPTCVMRQFKAEVEAMVNEEGSDGNGSSTVNQ